MNQNFEKTRLLALTALLFSLALIFSFVENSLPALIPTLPGVKLGLSNIVVMYALFFLKRPQAFAIALLKAVFSAAIRGLVAGLLSLSGGLLSLLVICLLMFLFREKISYLLLSVAGAVVHNVGQLAAVSMVYGSAYMFVHLPVLILSGVAAGAITASLLRLVMPALGRLKK